MVDIHKMEYLFSLNKREPDICGNIDESGGHYVKLNNPDRKINTA